MGQLIIVSSVSGAGKTTLVDNATILYNLYKLKTCTTRPVRPCERGDEYYFYSQEEFQDNIDSNEFFEYAEVYGNNYGLLTAEIEKFEEQNCIVILDVQGAETARNRYPDAVTIFIEPPSTQELKLRIMQRNTGTEDVERRLDKIDKEMLEVDKFTHIIHYDSYRAMTKQFNKVIEEIVN